MKTGLVIGRRLIGQQRLVIVYPHADSLELDMPSQGCVRVRGTAHDPELTNGPLDLPEGSDSPGYIVAQVDNSGGSPRVVNWGALPGFNVLSGFLSYLFVAVELKGILGKYLAVSVGGRNREELGVITACLYEPGHVVLRRVGVPQPVSIPLEGAQIARDNGSLSIMVPGKVCYIRF